MPAFLGSVKIVVVNAGGIVRTGNAVTLAPASADKTFAGAGSMVQGDFPVSRTFFNATITDDNDVADEDVAKV
ncbi:MAG TPA: spore germination protein [Bacilli bacterium]